MANDVAHGDDGTENGMDMPAHDRSYTRFLFRLKQGAIATAVIAALVVYLLAR